MFVDRCPRCCEEACVCPKEDGVGISEKIAKGLLALILVFGISLLIGRLMGRL